MPDNGKEEQKQPPTLEWIKSPNGVLEVYANNIHVTWSLDDVRVRYAQTVSSPKTPNPGLEQVAAFEERAAISLSWRMAKVLRDQLTKVIEHYEKANGPIKLDLKLPPSMQ
jgi:hypothetical protein